MGLATRRGQLAMAAVLLILGFLLVVQLRSQQAGTGLDRLASQDLTLLVANLNTRNDQLRAEVASLQGQLARVESAAGSGQQTALQLRNEIARDRAWAGLEPAIGSGVTVEITGPVGGAAVGEVLNELRNAGAEALAVAGVRVVAGTVPSGGPGAVTVDGAPAGERIVLRALGDPTALAGSLTRAGGIVALLAATDPDIVVTVTPADRIDVPGTARDLAPAHGTPRL
ncbi:MAG: DUF881 domain-containing protein [Chloroflexi bacterium]|nr:DUF881 domain-containing protein [Chloroflexota bacterium]